MSTSSPHKQGAKDGRVDRHVERNGKPAGRALLLSLDLHGQRDVLSVVFDRQEVGGPLLGGLQHHQAEHIVFVDAGQVDGLGEGNAGEQAKHGAARGPPHNTEPPRRQHGTAR